MFLFGWILPILLFRENTEIAGVEKYFPELLPDSLEISFYRQVKSLLIL